MADKTGLKRQLGLLTATALVAGEVIAVGIFLTPAGMIKTLGSPLLVFAVWLGMGLLTLCGALSYGELAARYPEAGGGYVYLRETYGSRLAFLYGWMCFLVMDPGITAALALGLAGYTVYLFELPAQAAKAVAIGAILAIAAANVIGVGIGAGVMRLLAAIKIALLLFIPLWAFGARLGSWSNFLPFAGQRSGLLPLAEALAGALVAAFFSFGGWWDASKIAGEVRDPARTVPRALIIGVSLVTFIYILTSTVFIYLVPPGMVSSGETFAAQAGEALFGRAGGRVFSGVVIISVLGSLAGLIMAAPRVYYAMAQDKLFFAGAARIHPRFGTPALAICGQAFLASMLVLLSGKFSDIVAYFVFVVVAFIGLTVASVLVLNRRSPERYEHRTFGYPVTPLMFLLLVVLMLLMLAGNNLKSAMLGIGVVLLGVPVYHLLFNPEGWARRKHA